MESLACWQFFNNSAAQSILTIVIVNKKSNNQIQIQIYYLTYFKIEKYLYCYNRRSKMQKILEWISLKAYPISFGYKNYQ